MKHLKQWVELYRIITLFVCWLIGLYVLLIVCKHCCDGCGKGICGLRAETYETKISTQKCKELLLVGGRKEFVEDLFNVFNICGRQSCLPGKKVRLKASEKRENQIDISSLGNTTYLGNLQETERETDILLQKSCTLELLNSTPNQTHTIVKLC